MTTVYIPLKESITFYYGILQCVYKHSTLRTSVIYYDWVHTHFRIPKNYKKLWLVLSTEYNRDTYLIRKVVGDKRIMVLSDDTTEYLHNLYHFLESILYELECDNDNIDNVLYLGIDYTV